TKTSEAIDSNAAGSQDHHRDDAHTAKDLPAIHLEPVASATAPNPASAGQASVTPPAIAPLAALTPLPGAPTSQPSNQPSTSIQTNTATGQRMRLPADVLAPAAQTTNRRTNVEIDTTRLLTRVARAV